MTAVIEVLLGSAALLLLLPVLVLLIEIIAAVLPPRRPARAIPVPPSPRPRLGIIVPAHDEALGIAATLRSLRSQLAPHDRLLVVADNCRDGTAAIARREGAEVLERHDDTHRGKGYALDAGVRALAGDPPGIVLFVDADCELAAGSIQRLAEVCALRNRPVQALYRMQAATTRTLHARVASFAWEVRNRVRAAGLARLALPCQLMGTGMAMPWELIRATPLATAHLVEDLWLGIELARRRRAPLFCPDARVLSRFPESDAGAREQRTRWEHGHLGLWLGVPRLLWESIAHRNAGLLALTLDLAVPPLALLALLLSLLLGATALLALATSIDAPVVLAGAGFTLFVLAILMAWLRFGRGLLSGRDIALAGLYAISKVPIYLKFLVARQLSWVRSRRR